MYDVILLLATLVFLAVCVWYARSGYFSVFHPFTLYLAFHGFLFVFRPIVARAMDFRFVYLLYQFTPTESDKCKAISIATVGLLSFAFFSFRQGNVPMRFHIDEATFLERRKLIPVFLVVAAICFPIGFYSIMTLWNNADNGTVLTSLVMDKATHLRVDIARNGYSKDAQLMLASSGAILAWLFRFRLWAILPWVSFVVLRAGSGGRGPFVAAAAALGLLWLYEKRLKWPSITVLLGIVATISAFNAVGSDRGRAVRLFFGSDKTEASPYDWSKRLKPMEGMDFANLEYLEFIVYIVPQRTHTFSYFTENLQLLTEPIPRALWPGKPVGAPIQLFNPFDYGNPIGMTSSLPGTGWVDAGWAGVVIWCGSWGYVLGWIYRKFAQGPQSAFQTIAYMTLLSSLIVALRDGALVTVARQNLFFMAPIVLWKVFALRSGIPSLARIRIWLGARNGLAGVTSSFAAAPAIVREPSLPPAVVRRRAALAAARGTDAALTSPGPH